MTKFINYLIDIVTISLIAGLLFLNIRFGADSGEALIGDSVAVFILIMFFSTRIDHIQLHHSHS